MKALLASILAISTGCAVSGDAYDGDTGGEQESNSTTYVDIMDFAKTDQGAWYDTIHRLNQKFDEACGDTFCEGEYSNITPLTFGCSVSTKLGAVHQCVWTFAASNTQVDSRNAKVLVDAPTFQCKIFTSLYSTKFIDLLNGPDPLNVYLGTQETITKQLSVCMENPIGATHDELAHLGTESYISASDYYTTFANQQKWRDAKAAMKSGWDNICGDTYCGSDYGDLQDLGVECAVTKSTGNVKSCTWTFGGSYHTTPEKTGVLQVSAKTWKCPLTMKGTLSQLITTLTAPGTTRAIDRALPGVTTSAYDQLANCTLAQ